MSIVKPLPLCFAEALEGSAHQCLGLLTLISNRDPGGAVLEHPWVGPSLQVIISYFYLYHEHGFEVGYPMGCTVSHLEEPGTPAPSKVFFCHHITAQENVPAWAGTGSCVWLPQAPSH